MKFKSLVILMAAAMFLYAAGNNNEGNNDARSTPRLLNYQGYLTDTLSNPITNPSVAMTFAVYDAVSAGNLKWTEIQGSVGVDKGIFHILLGGVNPIPDSVFKAGADRWLELTIGGQALSPRTRIVSVPYAYTATYSDTAQYARNSILDIDWSFLISDGADTTLQMGGRWGLARVGNTMCGNADSTHVNLGVGSTTGTNGQNYKYITVGGGYGNAAIYNWTTIGGGDRNTAGLSYATVSGGVQNNAGGQCATVGGGSTNIATSECATVAGGNVNTASNYNATVSGGQGNIASGYIATVGGGKVNRARGAYSVVSGGGGGNDADSNSAIGSYSAIGGGYGNIARGNSAVIGGGRQNIASSWYSIVGGGQNNTASNQYSTVGGGEANVASGMRATVAGGSVNQAAGEYSAILGGYADSIAVTGSYSYLFGINSNLTQDSTFMVDMPHVWFGTETNGYEFPYGRGTDGQVMKTNGSGILSWGAIAYVDSARVAANAHKLQGKDTVDFNVDYVNEGQVNSIDSLMLQNNAVTMPKISQAGATTGQVIKWNGTTWQPSADSSMDNDWSYRVTDGADTTLQMGGRWGLARFGNTMYGNADSTHVNLGIGSATGRSGEDNKYCTVGGGIYNTASGYGATVDGGRYNKARGQYSVVSGGGAPNESDSSSAIGDYSVIGGGLRNRINGAYATIGGGFNNVANGYVGTVAGGSTNAASGYIATVGGGSENIASSFLATVSGGSHNTASDTNAIVGGGYYNYAGGKYSAILGGYADSIAATGDYSYLFGINSNLTQDSTFMVDIPHVWFGTEANGYEFPYSRGTDGQVMKTNGSGILSWGSIVYVDSARVAANAHKLQGKDTIDLNSAYVNEGQVNSITNAMIQDGAVTTAKLSDTAVTMPKIAPAGATVGQVIKWNGTAWQPSADSSMDNDWSYRVTDGADTTLQMGGRWGIARAGNTLYGNADSTHVNLGVGSSTGTNGQNYKYSTVGGGWINSARNLGSTVGGGVANNASNIVATVGGGDSNTGSGYAATIAGGQVNSASNSYSTVGGGQANNASGDHGTISGGVYNLASGQYATVAGGQGDTASGYAATVGGGSNNRATGNYGTIAGGAGHRAIGSYSTVSGGVFNTASGHLSAVGGGQNNTVNDSFNFIGAGNLNSVSGKYSVILGGYADTIASTATYSYLFGINSNLTQGSTFMVDMPHIRFGKEGGGGYEFPNADGISGQALITNGGGNLSWATIYDKDWIYRVTDGADTTLQMNGRWGIARFGNTMYGNADSTHVNLGVGSTTGTSGQNNKYCTVGGGQNNTASGNLATVGGGYNNTASGDWYATVGGGYNNTASNVWATVVGGQSNTASGLNATVGGGGNNLASNNCATVGGGSTNTASNACATVGGGQYNTAADSFNFIGGGYSNLNTGRYSAILGGYADTVFATGDYSYLFGINSNLTQDSTFLVDMPHVWFGTEANGYEFPYGRGTNGQALVTNGSGQVSWASTNDNDWVINGSNMYSAVSGNVGIGLTSPSAKLDVAGTVKIADGTQALGRVFTSDASGLGSWQALPSPPVSSVFGRTGAVVAASGDYTTTLVTEGTNLYFTNARAQAAITGGASTITTSNLTANRALLSDGSGKVAVSVATNTELGYLSGVTSAIQTQLSGKAPTASPTFTGNVTMPGTGIWNSSGNVGIGLTTPSAKLDVAGTVKIVDGTQAIGRVFTSDANGLGSWQAIPNDNDWTFRVTDGADTTLQMGGQWGLARYGNLMYGNADSTHINLGVGSTTGTNGQNYKYCTVGGGYQNTASGNRATVSGGISNEAIGSQATVGGGQANTAAGNMSIVGGGLSNYASGLYTTVAGGGINTASGNYATVGGGRVNKARGQFSVVSGGGSATEADSNSAIGDYSAIGGGYHNVVTGTAAVISGGQWNVAGGLYSAIGGGGSNSTPNTYATVGGGVLNTASNDRATVGGGQQNTAAGYMSTVGGGQLNRADYMATVGGGWTNTASGNNSTVGGGWSNTASGSFATISGGQNNTAVDSLSYIGGGNMNSADGKYSAILGGYADSIFATGHYSYLFGINSNLTQDSTFLVDMPHIRFGTEATGYEFPKTDGSSGQALITNGSGQVSWGSPTDADWTISGSNMYSAVSGNVGIGTSSPAVRLHVVSSTSDTAAIFRGNLVIQSKATGNAVLELGEGLDYAEGFDVTQPDKIKPGTVLVIDPKSPGKLAVSCRAYDTKVAGIVAGGKGLGSGVRLGTGDFDHNVALAGRVYCNVDASTSAVEPGDLLTTANTPGYAMKAQNYDRAKGAVLGKAMERLEKGQKGQILVLVSLQ